MTKYEVDVPAMNALSVEVFSVASIVRGALGEVHGAACVDVGDGGLASALTMFGRLWAGFTEGSAQTVDATAGAIATACAGYVQTDEGVVADLRVTSAFVDAVAAGGDGSSALQAPSPPEAPR